MKSKQVWFELNRNYSVLEISEINSIFGIYFLYYLTVILKLRFNYIGIERSI